VLKTFLLFMAIVMLSHYKSPVNCKRRNIEGNPYPQDELRLLLSFSRPGMYMST
jgi:hypothetical protein